VQALLVIAKVFTPQENRHLLAVGHSWLPLQVCVVVIEALGGQFVAWHIILIGYPHGFED
jgi:hypothetical protein